MHLYIKFNFCKKNLTKYFSLGCRTQWFWGRFYLSQVTTFLNSILDHNSYRAPLSSHDFKFSLAFLELHSALYRFGSTVYVKPCPTVQSNVIQ